MNIDKETISDYNLKEWQEHAEIIDYVCEDDRSWAGTAYMLVEGRWEVAQVDGHISGTDPVITDVVQVEGRGDNSGALDSAIAFFDYHTHLERKQ